MTGHDTITVYGQTVRLPPLPEGEEVVDVVVVARTREGLKPRQRALTNLDHTGRPKPLTSELRYLAQLGLRDDQVANRIGATRLPTQ